MTTTVPAGPNGEVNCAFETNPSHIPTTPVNAGPPASPLILTVKRPAILLLAADPESSGTGILVVAPMATFDAFPRILNDDFVLVIMLFLSMYKKKIL